MFEYFLSDLSIVIFIKPNKKKIGVFWVPCQKKIGSVGQQNFFFRSDIFNTKLQSVVIILDFLGKDILEKNYLMLKLKSKMGGN